MTKLQLKQIIKECIKEIKQSNESFGVYQGKVDPLKSFYDRLKKDPILIRKKIYVQLLDKVSGYPSSIKISGPQTAYGDYLLFDSIKFHGVSSDGENKYEVTDVSPDGTKGGKKTITDENGVMSMVYKRIYDIQSRR